MKRKGPEMEVEGTKKQRLAERQEINCVEEEKIKTAKEQQEERRQKALEQQKERRQKALEQQKERRQKALEQQKERRQKALEQQKERRQEAQKQEDESECTDDEEEEEEEDEEETEDEDDGNCDNTCDEYDEEDEDEQEEEDGDNDLIEIDDDGNFDELKEKLKKINAGVVVKYYDSEADSKNCRKDDTFEGTIERIDKEQQNAQLKNAFLNNQAIAETVMYKMKDETRVEVKQFVLHPVYDKSNPSMMKYSYGTLTYNAVSDFHHSKPVNRFLDRKIKTEFEELMKKVSCRGCDDIGHVIGYSLGGSYDARNLFLQNPTANFNMKGFEKRQLSFLVRDKGRSIDYIVEYINGDNINGVVRYKEVVWHLRYHAENGLVGELHFTMPNPRSAKETYFKKKQEAIDSEKYAEPNLEFETNYGNLPNYIMKYNVDWDKVQLSVRDDCEKNSYDTPDFNKEISRSSDGQITLHSIFSNGGKRLEYLYGQFEVKKLPDTAQTKKWRNALNLKAVGPVKFAEKNALPGDQYGHVLSACLGGSFDDVNMYPQNEEINMDMGSFELGIYRGIGEDMRKDKVTVEAIFNFTYASSGVGNVKHPRPESTNVCLRIKNGKQGKWRAICFDLPNPESVLRPYYEEFAKFNQDNFFVSTIPMTKEGQDSMFAQYGFTVSRKGVHNRMNNIICPVCKQKAFGTDQYLLSHLRIHDDYRLKDLECCIPECTYRTDRKSNLKKHMKEKHGDPKSKEIKRRECDVTRKDGQKCTFYAYTPKEMTDHRDKHEANVNNFKLDCPVSTACPFMADTLGGFNQHIKRVHEKPEEQSCKGRPGQAPPGTQSDKKEIFKCPIDGCNMGWTIESTKFQQLIENINCHLEKQHREKESRQKFHESELKQLVEEKRIKDSNGKDVKLMPCEKGCLRIFRGNKGREKHYRVNKEEYYEAHRKDRTDPNNPEWTDEEKEILKKHKLKPSSNNKKSFLQVEILKPYCRS
ncbi:hypothetical protein WR25_24297 isoform C [Diploscapter pachys]|uniref:C2H2-type domain-containing protein n=1 Tax=Diploscapter pachys TaxID=2018661 RepID=A0A2A2LRF5_9BILA|nr:hypothetical protein WR25_24297 isoform A [Diploscapter pachys]PAV88748.1 hypothetical protein WR25_24297 isoform B [Diploscapter pachys]PAV88749.1 hypothetical protein WR25_24297 isoform C [Diploscapter pachys]